ncbi:uncharacterized protein LOC105423923, partial [Pogonomyrmex barbatus]|uniref:Uncharacterized protein LOC105423923 n=1 Tax=Pogonomyrmex barbatus TaxID=144034 RepID=A0A6I9VVQ5_9HYME
IALLRFSEIPGRWRRHCPHGPMMSGAGCNLVGEGVVAAETGNAAAAGKCVCGPSVPWCPGEPRPYMYTTRHECRLNLEAKIAYDDLYNSGDTPSSTAIEGIKGKLYEIAFQRRTMRRLFL